MIPASDLSNWTDYIPVIQVMMNNKILTSSKSRAFELFFNRYFDSSRIGRREGTIDEEVNWLHKSQELYKLVFPRVMERIADYRKGYAKDFNSNHTILPDLVPGTLVMVRNFIRKKKDKMMPRWNGPYIVKKLTSNGTYEVETVDGECYPNKVARNGLKELPNDFMEHQPNTKPQEWEVEAIKTH